MYFLIDLERTIGIGIVHYWRRNKHGYTTFLEEAGLFEENAAKEIVESDIDKRTVMVSEEVVKRLRI